MSVQQNFPHMAAQWRVEAGESVSLSAAAKAGILEMNPSVEKELLAFDAYDITGQQEAAARREAVLLASLEQGATELAAKREKGNRSGSSESPQAQEAHPKVPIRQPVFLNFSQERGKPIKHQLSYGWAPPSPYQKTVMSHRICGSLQNVSYMT